VLVQKCVDKLYHISRGENMRLALGLRIVLVAVCCLVGGKGIASVEANAGHKTSLPAVITMADGTTKAITLEGVGCTASMCSRVRARENNSDSIWLDGLTSMRHIRDANGAVQATFTFNNGIEREGSIAQDNRVLYISRWLGNPEKLDLARIHRIDFVSRKRKSVPQYPNRDL
jgi:hypothetical protein